MKKQILSLCIYFSLALFAPTIEADEHEHSGICIKCGTPQIMESILLGTAKIARRSEMDAWAVSTHFRVHYDTTGFHAPDMTDKDGNVIPDYVDSTLVFLEYAWDLAVNQLGYIEPLNDDGKGGGDEIDVYLKDLNNVYGQTWPETSMGSFTSSYIEIDNDFSENIYHTNGYDALRVTTAHEFFHTIHFSSYYDICMGLTWWMEQTAVWMEDRAWDDVNDYLAYLNYFFNNKETPLTTSNGKFEYGAAIWAMYLAERFGDDIIRDLWEHVSKLKKADIAIFDDIIPIGLPSALGEFAVWNYFTKGPTVDRANPIDFYSDSNLFKQSVNTDSSVSKSPAHYLLSTKHLTSRYVELLFVGDWGENDALRVNIIPLDGGSYVNSLIFYNEPFDYRIHIVDPSGEDIPLERTWKNAILVTSCTNTIYANTKDFTYKYTFDAEILENYEEHYAFSVKGTYPNPFNSSTTISFVLPESGNVSIQAFNALGQRVENIFIGRLEPGKKEILWKPSNLSSGVYLVKMNTPWGTKIFKTLYLK